MFDVITFGSATWDNFLRLKKEYYKILPEKILNEEKALCLPLGAKVYLDDKQSASGGGGTNVATTLALQGFRVAYCGKVGCDKEGDQILQELKERKIDASMCLRDKEYSTAYSAILSLPEEERTVLIYRGACHFLREAELSKAKILKTKWFYLAPLSGQTANLFEK
ncbi:MAG: carbohydrate kinase family protein, partial [Candidatus Gribaldobacteria bacterium]|nr:carbohydrate kinase family protein [Candidatus Gribaldobacteria bacterium]